MNAFWSASLVCLTLAIAACASSPSPLKYERKSFGKSIGLEGCWISVPLTPSEVVEIAKLGGNPDPESDAEWIAMAAELRAGDQLRWIACSSVNGGGGSYYALIRDGSTILKFYPAWID